MAKEVSRLQKKRARGQLLMTLPLILFTVLFLVGPIVYMVVLSFLTRGETWGVVPEFTLKNYTDIAQPVYLQTFGQSLQPWAIPLATLWQSWAPSGKNAPCSC